MVAHLGVAVFVVGVTLVKGYESDRDVKMRAGDTVELAGYAFRLEGVTPVRGPNYTAAQAKVVVTKGARQIAVMYPEPRKTIVAVDCDAHTGYVEKKPEHRVTFTLGKSSVEAGGATK